MLASGAELKFLRDPTRGGVAGVLVDMSEDTGLTVEVRERDLPISRAALHAAEMLGLDLLTVANEGNCVAVVSAVDLDCLLAACHRHPLGRNAVAVGRFVQASPPLVELISRVGGRRIVRRAYGEELPRIC